MPPTLLWFRHDLRLEDNPALNAALARGAPIVPVFVLDDRSEGRWAPGAASRWWLHRSLEALDARLRACGSRLILASGDTEKTIAGWLRATRAGAVHWNRRSEPAARGLEERIERLCTAEGVVAHGFQGALLRDPESVANREGGPFQMFTPFWRHCLTLPVEPPVRLGSRVVLPAPAVWPRSLRLDELGLNPKKDWDGGLREEWTPGEAAAAGRMGRFLALGMEAYAVERDFPGKDGTSALSAALHFGEISPRQAWAAIRAQGSREGIFPPSKGAGTFLAELGWREFAHHLLHHFPDTTERPLRRGFERFPWAADPGGRKLRAWRRGLTGYPIVDAGMRQLWRTGWMHNRARMITASFLVKHLRLPWSEGAAWFWDTLVDADLANNTLGWQWSAGCGADAAPYFRIFSPVRQGERFDPEGAYVRRWVPELTRLPARHLHAPWDAPPAVLAAAGVRLGRDGNYPSPIVDHATARAEALAAWRKARA